MQSRSRLYHAFGELIYTVSLADGMIQLEELDKLHEVLINHPWGQEIKWSFDYEALKNSDSQETYDRALQVLIDHGPDEEYVFLVDILEQIAEASNGIVPEEREVIDSIQQSLRDHFMLYLDDNELI